MPTFLRKKFGLFIVCDYIDEIYLDELDKQLQSVKGEFLVSNNIKGILGGDDTSVFLANKISKSNVILFLVSPDFNKNTDSSKLLNMAFGETNEVKEKTVVSVILKHFILGSKYDLTIKYPQKPMHSIDQPVLSKDAYERGQQWAKLVNKLLVIANVKKGDLAFSKKEYYWAILFYKKALEIEPDSSINEKITNCRIAQEIQIERKKIGIEIETKYKEKYRKEAELTDEVATLNNVIKNMNNNEMFLNKVILFGSLFLLISVIFSVCTCRKYNASLESKLAKQYREISKVQPLSIVTITLANKVGEKRKDFENEIKKEKLRYLCVSVKVNKYSTKEESVEFLLKIYDRNGGLITSNKSPKNFTSGISANLAEGISDNLDLVCIGQDEPSYEEGVYRIEIFQKSDDEYKPLGFKFLKVI